MATSDTLLPFDALRGVCHFDDRLAPMRSARRPCQQANASEQMAGLLMGTHESGELTGAHVPRVGQHIVLPEGGADALSGGIAALAKDQRFKLHNGVHTSWQVAFEEEIIDADGSTSAEDVLERFSVAADVLRENANNASFRAPRANQRFAAVQGDVDGGASAVALVLSAMREACAAVTSAAMSHPAETLPAVALHSAGVQWTIA